MIFIATWTMLVHSGYLTHFDVHMVTHLLSSESVHTLLDFCKPTLWKIKKS